MYYYIFFIFLAPLFALFAVAAFDQQRYAVVSPTHFFHFLPRLLSICVLSLQNWTLGILFCSTPDIKSKAIILRALFPRAQWYGFRFRLCCLFYAPLRALRYRRDSFPSRVSTRKDAALSLCAVRRFPWGLSPIRFLLNTLSHPMSSRGTNCGGTPYIRADPAIGGNSQQTIAHFFSMRNCDFRTFRPSLKKSRNFVF